MREPRKARRAGRGGALKRNRRTSTVRRLSRHEFDGSEESVENHFIGERF
ncbi:hypothetical protein BURMUCGD2M_3958 [Burkholderia multivorans CGD2M]|nr:hypothetical protein BURMUCGD2M_3958 [Burkholderia multivorans CGD2M]